ncbi:MAG: long-chain fatty acid--CoA ligase [Alphaproteobacteria bacterium]|nr:long-chain fatty acid--CoA ligase [Alphaproteobacteria bacterium SS10]
MTADPSGQPETAVADTATEVSNTSTRTSLDRPWIDNYPRGVDWSMTMTPQPVYEIVESTAAKLPNRTAIDFLGKTYSYAELQQLIDEVAAGLQANGLTKGDRVGLLLPNSPYFVALFYGVLKAGGVVVNINPLYAEREIENLVRDSGLDMLATLDLAALYDKLKPVMDEGLKKVIVCPFTNVLPFPKNMLFKLLKGKELASVPTNDQHIRFDELRKPGGQPDPVEINPVEDIAVLQYTGGTTGIPKGAMLTHANLHVNAQQAVAWFDGAKFGEEVMMGVLPYFHVFAMTASMNLGIAFGSTLILQPRFELKPLLKALQKHKVTLFPAVPAIYTAINNSPELANYDLSSIRLCISGGAPLPLEVKQQFEKATGCTLEEGYGLTESSPVACMNPLDGSSKAGSIGQPVPGTSIEIISLEDRKTPMPLGEVGEVCIRGPQVMKGYWRREDATAETLIDGLLHTGDVGYTDEQGYTFIVDRLKDMILVNGYNVYPRNIEEAIYLHEAVEECVVAGVNDPKRGEVPKVWIKLKDGKALDDDGLKTFLKDKLSPIELPRQIEFRDQPLPKTLIGKLSRKDLLAEHEKEQAGG